MIGQTISHYRIQEKLGEGGMGVVYKAEDTKLGRNVALKFLAPHLVSDEDVRTRFELEAKAVAVLDHPNVCTVFEIDEAGGTVFIAMALVEGVTVKERIAQGPLKVEEALHIAAQTADGIRTAHAKGIIHRDIKPANIMVNQQRQVKVMDFGLARLIDTTVTLSAVVKGTPAYMSPEQTQGQPADARSDIWSLGVLLYEMVAGRRPFRGDRIETVFHAIQNTQPEPITAVRDGLPMGLEWIISKCLAKNPAERYQRTDDVFVDLSALHKKLDGGAKAPAAIGGRKSLSRSASFAGAGAVVLIVAGLAMVGARMFRQPSETAALRTVKFTITPAKLVRGSDTDIDSEVSISPDGRHIAYVEAEGGQLMVRDLDQEQARPVPGATKVYQAFWSSDNKFIGYVEGGFAPGRNMMRIPVEGGTPAPIVKQVGSFRRANWSSDGQTILYCDTTGLYTVPAKGGPPTRILEHTHIEHPSFLDLPDGRQAFLYQAVDEGSRGHGIYVQFAGDRRLLTMSSSSNPYPAYSPTGHIVFVDGTGDSAGIWALPFSLETLQPTGKVFPVARSGSSPQVSKTGTLVYSDVPPIKRQLAWYDRSGNCLSKVGEPSDQFGPVLSPDGRKLAVSIRDTGIWIYDLARGIKTRLTADSATETLGGWSPSGDEIVYASNRNGNLDLFSKSPDSDGEARSVVATPAQEGTPEWSRDGRFLIYVMTTRETRADLMYRKRQKDGSLGEPVPFVKTPLNEGAPRFSPDGRFVAYISDESGSAEVFVRDFPSGAHKWQISANGGTAPRWSRDGREIFYAERHKLMAVRVSTQPAFSPGVPAALFEVPSVRALLFDVAPDGKRFMIADRPGGEKPLAIHVAHNWFEEFRGREQSK